jgi:hypothetical protein
VYFPLDQVNLRVTPIFHVFRILLETSACRNHKLLKKSRQAQRIRLCSSSISYNLSAQYATWVTQVGLVQSGGGWSNLKFINNAFAKLQNLYLSSVFFFLYFWRPNECRATAVKSEELALVAVLTTN